MIQGIVFDYRNVTAKDDGQIYHGIFPRDGILAGCEINFTSGSVTVGDGYFVMCGRVLREDGAETLEITPTLQTGYMRLRYRIDLNIAPSPDQWDQGEWLFDYSATPEFPAPVQEDVNASGAVYEMEFAVFQVTGGNMTALTRSAGPAGIDAATLNEKPPEYYMNAQSDRGSTNAADSVGDGITLCNSGLPAELGTHAYVMQVTHSPNRTQFAWPYNTAAAAAGMWTRVFYTGAWQPWQSVGNSAMTATYRGSANNANSMTDGVALCNANIPSGMGALAYVIQITYAARKMQLAVPYASTSPTVWVRAYVNDAWTAWADMATGAALAAVSAVANAALARSGGTMTGNIVMGSNAVTFGGAQLKQNGSNVIASLGTRLESLTANGSSYAPMMASAFTVNTSYRALKTNEKPVEGALEVVKAATVYEYDLKETGEHAIGIMIDDAPGEMLTDTEFTPEIAEAAGLIDAKAARKMSDGDKVAAKGVDLYKMVSVCMAAVQELAAEKDAEIAALRARIEKIEKMLEGK